MERTDLSCLGAGALDEALARLYGRTNLEEARGRCAHVVSCFEEAFHCPPEALFSAPGRTEIGGNHTDHQHGHVLAAAVDLDILAAVRPNGSGIVRLQSEGYPVITVELSDLTPKKSEENTSAALIRGVAARMSGLGAAMGEAGLDAYVVSNVPGGSGLSSSAAFEVLMGTIFNELYFGGRCTPVEIAQIGQYAENEFFGKPCGLMDETASSVGGVVSIDFTDPDVPVVEQVELDLAAQGHALCIMDSHASHADLTGEYAAITAEMKKVSGMFGRQVLREVSEDEFMAALPSVRREAGDRAVLRAMHFYAEDRRAVEEAEALKAGRFDRFLDLVRQSGRSSALYLQNVIPTGQTEDQSLMLTIALAEKLLDGRGAVRVHGGGFGGTAQAFVPLEVLDTFRAGMEALLGPGSCHVAAIRPVGGVRLA